MREANYRGVSEKNSTKSRGAVARERVADEPPWNSAKSNSDVAVRISNFAALIQN